VATALLLAAVFKQRPECEIGILEPLTPFFLEPIVKGWCTNPLWTVTWIIALIGIAIHSTRVKANTDNLAECAWQHITCDENHHSRDLPPVGKWEELAGKLRNDEASCKRYRWVIESLSPWLFLVLLGPLALFFIYYILSGLGRWLFGG